MCSLWIVASGTVCLWVLLLVCFVLLVIVFWVWFNSGAFILMLYVFMLASACCGLVGWWVFL